MTSETENGAIKVTVTMEIPPEAFGKFIEAIPPDARQQLFVDGPKAFFEAFAAAASSHIIKSLKTSPELWNNWLTAACKGTKFEQKNETDSTSTAFPILTPWPWAFFRPPQR